MSFASNPKEYVVSIETNSIRSAIRQLSSSLYDLLEQTLMTSDEDDDSDFGHFARETLNVLRNHPQHITSEAEKVESDEDDDEDPPFEE